MKEEVDRPWFFPRKTGVIVRSQSLIEPSSPAAIHVHKNRGNVESERAALDSTDLVEDGSEETRIRVEHVEGQDMRTGDVQDDVVSNPPSPGELQFPGDHRSDVGSVAENPTPEQHLWWHPLVLLQKKTAPPPPIPTVEDRIGLIETKLSAFETGVTGRLDKLEMLLQTIVERLDKP